MLLQKMSKIINNLHYVANYFVLCYTLFGWWNMIERNEYLEALKNWKDKDLIKVVTGIRRCGKSTLFELFINYLKQSGVKEDHIISLNLESPEYNFNDYMELYNY